MANQGLDGAVVVGRPDRAEHGTVKSKPFHAEQRPVFDREAPSIRLGSPNSLASPQYYNN